MTDTALGEVKIETLPTIPHTLLELIRLFEQPVVEFDALADLIRQDPVITARIFKLANTIYFRQWREITQLQQLLVVLGMDSVRQIALLCATEQIFSQFEDRFNISVTTLWYRSLLCAHIAEELADLVGHNPKYEAYLTGLLHRIGQLALICNAPQRYLEKIDITLDLNRAETIERRQFHTTSAETGASVVRTWQLCPFIADAIQFQTQPADNLRDSTPLVRLLALSRTLCDQGENENISAAYAAARLFDLSYEMVEQIRERAQQRTASIISHFTSTQPSSSLSPHEALQLSYSEQQNKLRQQVKNYALTNALRTTTQHLDSHREAFNRLRRDFHLLFGLNDLCFLLTESEHDRLCGYDDLGTRPALKQVSVHLDNWTSLALKAFQKGEILCNADKHNNGFSVPDRQLENLMGSEALCFIPLPGAQRSPGVIVAAVTCVQWQSLSAQKSLLHLAAQLAGQTIEATTQAEQTANSRQQQEREELQLNLRATAHEINNPLSIINNYLYLLSQQLETDEQAKEQIEIIQEEISRVGTLVSGLKDLTSANDTSAQQSSVQINELIQQLQRLFASSLFQARQQELHLDLAPELQPITSYAGSLKQILINLLKNASEALPPQGSVWVSTRGQVYKNNRQYVEIEIRDDGPGIDGEILRQLFQPVTSTKKGHSGLGLTIVKNLVDQLQGEISCSSSNAGTRFQILLPCALT